MLSCSSRKKRRRTGQSERERLFVKSDKMSFTKGVFTRRTRFLLENVTAIYSIHQCVFLLLSFGYVSEDTNISSSPVNKYQAHRCIWSDAGEVTRARKDSELRKRSLTEREREQKMLRRRPAAAVRGDDTTSSLYGWERDYKSNENTIYWKRSKSVWLIKTRWRRREERKVHERDFFLEQMRTLFLCASRREREKFAHKITAIVVFLSFSLFPSYTFVYLHFYTIKEDVRVVMAGRARRQESEYRISSVYLGGREREETERIQWESITLFIPLTNQWLASNGEISSVEREMKTK